MIIYEKDSISTITTPHILMTIPDDGGKEVRSASKQQCGDICVAEVTTGTRQCLLIAVYINPGTSLCSVQYFLSYYLTDEVSTSAASIAF